MLSPELPPWESWSRGTLWGYLTQAFWLFPILCCLKKSLPCPAPPQTPSPCPRTSLWTRPVVRARSSRNVQAAGGLWAAFHLNPWHLQTWPGASRTVSVPTFPLLSPALSRPGTLEKAVSWPSRQRWSLEGRSGARIPAQNTKKIPKTVAPLCLVSAFCFLHTKPTS